jgi:hypothetical protein
VGVCVKDGQDPPRQKRRIPPPSQAATQSSTCRRALTQSRPASLRPGPLTPLPLPISPGLQIDLVRGMMDCLYAECTPIVTDCVMAELEKLGQKYRVALKVAKVGGTQQIFRVQGSGVRVQLFVPRKGCLPQKECLPLGARVLAGAAWAVVGANWAWCRRRDGRPGGGPSGGGFGALGGAGGGALGLAHLRAH